MNYETVDDAYVRIEEDGEWKKFDIENSTIESIEYMFIGKTVLILF